MRRAVYFTLGLAFGAVLVQFVSFQENLFKRAIGSAARRGAWDVARRVYGEGDDDDDDDGEESVPDPSTFDPARDSLVPPNMIVPNEDDDVVIAPRGGGGDASGESQLLELMEQEASPRDDDSLQEDSNDDEESEEDPGPVMWSDVPDKYKINQERILVQKSLAKTGNGTRAPPRFFVYNPSGGWGNQRYEIRWAIVAANAMDRTLILPAIAPHSSMYWGYNKFEGKDLLPAARVLDMEALNRVVKRGVLSHNDTLASLRERYLNKLSFWSYDKKEGWWSFDKLKRTFSEAKADVIFFTKSSIWCCCGVSSKWTEYLTRHIIFNRHLRLVSRALMRAAIGSSSSSPAYNAVHVRRGDHVMMDRRSPEVYFKEHRLDKFDRKLPLYVATDEQDRRWFRPWERRRSRRRFARLIFWKDLPQETIREELRHYPKKMQPDVLGFIELLICARAKKWEGSNRSTFSYAIALARRYPEAHSVSAFVALPPRPSGRMS